MKIPPPAPASNLSEIIAYGFWMRREGYRPSTIQAAISALKAIAKHANLLYPEAVKTHFASRKVSLGRKAKICEDSPVFVRPCAGTTGGSKKQNPSLTLDDVENELANLSFGKIIEKCRSVGALSNQPDVESYADLINKVRILSIHHKPTYFAPGPEAVKGTMNFMSEVIRKLYV